MIPVAIVWLIRRYMKKNNTKISDLLRQFKNHFPKFIAFLLLVILVLLSVTSKAQKRSLSYSIIRNGSKVGTIQFSQTTNGGMNYLNLESEVKTRFIFTFTAKAKEEAVYSNGVLLHSSIYRQMNGSEKANKQHEAVNNQYVIHAGKKTETVKNYPITFNMLSLYTTEPVDIGKVYSDNFQTFLSIERSESHKYKITMPDGNYNYYYYQNGILKTVEVHHSLYSATIVLTAQS